MPITTITRSAVRTLKTADRNERRLDLTRADALIAIKGEGYSLGETVKLLAAEGVSLSKTRISLLIRAREAAPADVTADDFVTVYVKGVTDANREGAKAKRDAKAETGEGEGGTVPQGNDAPEARPVTVTDAVRLLWELVDQFGEDQAFVNAYVTAQSFVGQTIAV